jgi:dihydrofolate reductase
MTMGKPVVMGRKTYLSIGKPLSGRTTIVVSRERTFAAPGVLVAPSLEQALTAARGDALRRGAEAIIIAGGADIYMQVMPQATRLAITQVHMWVEGDVRFPPIDAGIWRETSRSEHDAGAGDEAAFAFVHYERAVAAVEAPAAGAQATGRN